MAIRSAVQPDQLATALPSGEQIEICHGDQRAAIVEVGGGIRSYQVGDRPVLQSYGAGEMCDAAHGTPLLPWPNRLADGQYHFDGADHQLELTEPSKGNAIHGLLRWRSWRVTDRESDRVTMATRLHPMPGYPFALDVAVMYRLGETGLVVQTTARNVGATVCPVGSGQHPYLSPGTGLINDCVLTFAAAQRIVTDEERQLPTGTAPVEGSAFDFRDGRKIGDLRIDSAFTDLDRDADGCAWVRLAGPDERSADLWLDRHFSFLEFFTGDTLAPHRQRRGLGVEPMTCAPNAFRSGEGLLRLEPGEEIRPTWGVALR